VLKIGAFQVEIHFNHPDSFQRWYAAIKGRRSRRRYAAKLVEPEAIARLNALCAEFKPFPGVRAAVVTQSPEEVFKGAIGHYGKIKGAPAFIAFLCETSDPYCYEKAGYIGECIVLEAVNLGLATCWVGGFFRPEAAAALAGAGKNERVLAVTPVGYAPEEWSLEEKIMTGFGRNHRRKSLPEMVTGLPEGEWPTWVKAALEAARLAPSAMNRQPWRFFVESQNITVSVDNLRNTYNLSKRLDCGIAMLHAEVAAFSHGVRGTWELLDPPGVARFLVSPGIL